MARWWWPVAVVTTLGTWGPGCRGTTLDADHDLLGATNSSAASAVAAAAAAAMEDAFPDSSDSSDSPDPCAGPPPLHEGLPWWDLSLWRERVLENPSTYEPSPTINSTPFVVLSAPRSASNTLNEALNAHPLVQAQGEVWSWGSVHGRFTQVEHGGQWTSASRDANRTGFMRELFEREDGPAKPGARARGFKAFSMHLAPEEIALLSRSKRVLKIVLRRQDTLSQFVSTLRAFQTDAWHRPAASPPAEKMEEPRVPVCLDWYHSWKAAQDWWFDWCAEESKYHPESWIFVTSEVLVSDPFAMAAIYAFLKVPPVPDIIEYSPYTTDVLGDKIANPDDVRGIPRLVDNRW